MNYEDTMFFPRLRRQAKWMFVFLALVFGVGYVVFNVGGTIPGTGLGDVLSDFGQTGGVNVGDARKKAEKNPRDAAAQLDLARALQAEGRRDEATAVLERYIALRPKDQNVLRELAGITLTEGDRLRGQAGSIQAEAQSLSGLGIFGISPTSDLGQALGQGKIELAVSTRANERLTTLYGEMQGAYGQSLGYYKRLIALEPADANLQLQLAYAAQSSGDTAAAIAAYERFLEIAPDDPTAPQVRRQLEVLRASPTAQPG